MKQAIPRSRQVHEARRCDFSQVARAGKRASMHLLGNAALPDCRAVGYGGEKMFFTRLARIVAFIALALGAFKFAVGFLIASGVVGPAQEALARYLPGTATTGEAIDRGLYVVIFAIALGTLADISAKI